MGKTFSLRLLLLAAALDPIAELHLYDLKGTGDLSALAPAAHANWAGDDVNDIEYAVADMRALHAELRRRTKVIRDLPREVGPENKITARVGRAAPARAVAGRARRGRVPAVVRAPGVRQGVDRDRGGPRTPRPGGRPHAIFATPRPDAKSIPTGISGNAILRFCLKVMDHVANDHVLGTSAHRNGIKATVFSRKDLGIGWLAGEDDDPQITHVDCRVPRPSSPGRELCGRRPGRCPCTRSAMTRRRPRARRSSTTSGLSSPRSPSRRCGARTW
jgi:S-DNA-T family DNA segregation ATPase FtsK/SpoIIIE